ncbi:MAG: UDP-N-acetylmuramoyl-L-alanine--D-glutamate ligase, partial [Sulfobacillus sp.]
MAGPQRIAIVGLGVNNQPLVPFFLGRGDHVIVADRKPKVNIEHTLTAMGWDPGAVQVLGS